MNLWRVCARGETVDGGLFESEDWSSAIFVTGCSRGSNSSRSTRLPRLKRRLRPLAHTRREPRLRMRRPSIFERFVAALMAADPDALRERCVHPTSSSKTEADHRRTVAGCGCGCGELDVPRRAEPAIDSSGRRSRHGAPHSRLVRAEYADDGMELDRLVVVELMQDEARCQRRVVFSVDDEDVGVRGARCPCR